ncbi:hypothetical protein N0V83_001171 [Neocucurbitaria cava]|uniref:Short chain dehydrogenase n=1 Tax=Neocucurbitaria cava TaxID=798079 RepID=A0A9W9CQZ4_9PLEO|nr:hypothetical protein N0V83_001171 [Neocucurbitaria cava]
MSSTSKPVALITGANRGIGFELARTLARDHNFQVIIGSRSDSSGLEAFSKLRAEGLFSVTGVTLDVSSDDSIVHAAKSVEQNFGRLDLLINNAGIMLPDSQDSPIATKRKAFQSTFNTNVTGAAVVTETFIPLLSKSTLPRILFLGSTLGSITGRLDENYIWDSMDSISYRCSKAALSMLAAQYARRYGEKGWKVNIVCPGYVKTGMVNFMGTITTEEAMPHLVKMCTLGENGESGTFSDAEGTVLW